MTVVGSSERGKTFFTPSEKKTPFFLQETIVFQSSLKSRPLRTGPTLLLSLDYSLEMVSLIWFPPWLCIFHLQWQLVDATLD